jgi:hypothetical protein
MIENRSSGAILAIILVVLLAVLAVALNLG